MTCFEQRGDAVGGGIVPIWEYLFVAFSRSDPQADGGEHITVMYEHFKALGQQGWELVAVVSENYIFKRPKLESADDTGLS